MVNAKPAMLSSLRLKAVPTRFELAVSSLTGRHVRPLHHGTKRNVRQLYRLASGSAIGGELGCSEGIDKGFLAQREREVATRFLEDAARAVRRAAQPTRERIRIVECHK